MSALLCLLGPQMWTRPCCPIWAKPAGTLPWCRVTRFYWRSWKNCGWWPSCNRQTGPGWAYCSWCPHCWLTGFLFGAILGPDCRGRKLSVFGPGPSARKSGSSLRPSCGTRMTGSKATEFYLMKDARIIISKKDAKIKVHEATVWGSRAARSAKGMGTWPSLNCYRAFTRLTSCLPAAGKDECSWSMCTCWR